MVKPLLGIILCGSAIAQSGNGRISGLVRLCSDSPPADEKVCVPLQNIGVSLGPAGTKETSARVMTGQNGKFEFVDVQANTYDISFAATGFKPEIFRSVKVDPTKYIEMTPVNMGVGFSMLRLRGTTG